MRTTEKKYFDAVKTRENIRRRGYKSYREVVDYCEVGFTEQVLNRAFATGELTPASEMCLKYCDIAIVYSDTPIPCTGRVYEKPAKEPKITDKLTSSDLDELVDILMERLRKILKEEGRL